MVTKTRVKFIESSKAVSSEALVESDEMSADEVLSATRELALKAQQESQLMTMRKMRGNR